MPAVIWIGILTMICLTVGEPSVLDGIAHWLMSDNCVTTGTEG